MDGAAAANDFGAYDANSAMLSDDFYSAELADEPAETEAERKPRRRGLIAAAVVAGIAVVGGVGAFVMSFGDGDQGNGPAIIAADDGPVKVKPKDPGGKTVPSQENEVYEQAAGNDVNVAPTQQKLVTAEEEPVDLLSQQPVGNAPIAAGTGGEGAPQETVAKAEDRIAPQAQPETEGVGAGDDLVAVTPRRVRTMIVRPDGTLVERPDSAPETAAAAAAPAQSAATAQPLQAPAQDGQDAGAIQDMASADVSGTDETTSMIPDADCERRLGGGRPGGAAERRCCAQRSAACGTARQPAAGCGSADRSGRLSRTRGDSAGSNRWRNQRVVDADRFAANRRRCKGNLRRSRAALRQRSRGPWRQHREGRYRGQGHLLSRAHSLDLARRGDRPVLALQGCRRKLLRFQIAGPIQEQREPSRRTRRLFAVPGSKRAALAG